MTDTDATRAKEKRRWLGRWRHSQAAGIEPAEPAPPSGAAPPLPIETEPAAEQQAADTVDVQPSRACSPIEPSDPLPDALELPGAPAETEAAGEETARPGWFSRLRRGLSRSSSKLTSGITGLFTQRRLDDAALEELEELLISADLGVETAARLTGALAKARFDQEVTPEEIRAALAEEIAAILEPVAQTITLSDAHKPHVILVCGVNGSGKTTTIAKLAHLFQQLNLKVILAAGDTFRAAAIEQLQIWGDRIGCPVIARAAGSDAASLAFEAYAAAKDQEADVLLIDTAGRLHNKAHLMAELQKIERVLRRIDERAPHDCLLVLDSTVGQNAHNQVQVFRDMVTVTGLAVTKLDGSAKGGVVVALADRFRLPVFAIGVGEGLEDMRAFSARAFARSLLDLEEYPADNFFTTTGGRAVMIRGSSFIQRILTVLFGEPVDRSALPDRVRQAISDQQSQSEIIISWLQLALILFFILLYAIAPKTSAGTPFTPVPYVLGAYLFFTLLRLLLAQRRLLTRWFLIGSALVDIALLFGLIWSFHLQYGQPAAFYLKAPTLLYVFLFIALRTLRFQPGYVVVTGVAAAVGWLALVWYAIDPRGGPPGIVTRDYVRYLTSNVVLIGGEVDKIVTILLVTAVLAVSLVRAGRLLIRSVVDATAARDLTRFVAPEVANRIVSSHRAIEPGDSEEKVATVMFCDIEGFSGIAERLPPGVLMHTLNAYFEAVQSIIEDYNGVITQFQGDAMLVTFNAVRPDEHHAASALRAAAAIQDLVARARFGPDLRLPTRCGINTGKMITGAVGSRERLYFTVYGDEVNVAARLEQLNKRLGTYVLAAAACCEAAGTILPMRQIGEVVVRGRDAPVLVYTLDRSLP